jgi:hypothetical protein
MMVDKVTSTLMPCPMEDTPTSAFFGKLAIAIAGAFACALSAGLMMPADARAPDGSAVTVLVLVGVSVYLLAALAHTSVSAILRRLFSQ